MFAVPVVDMIGLCVDQTAEKIGMACNLLETAMEREGNLLKIEGDSLETVTKQVNDCYKHVRRLVARTKPDHMNKDPDEPDVEPPLVKGAKPRPLILPQPVKLPRPVGLVLESHSYALIMSSVPAGEKASPLLRKFLYVATHCKSVVACRCQPSTKSSIVGLIKQTQNVTTLAIGDGANDEQMIRAASVGVGIRGVEGTTAVQASDYSISQFHFLRRLLFVHGRLSLRRVSILICYIFYKTTLMCFCVFWFGIFSGFSGQNLVMEWAYQLYNVIFTALPVLIFAVFDKDLPAEVLEQHPDIYRISSSPFGHFFNARIFWSKWMLQSFIHSLIIFFFPYAVYQSHSVEPTGQSQGMWEMGIVLYTCVVLTTNLKLALLFRSWTWLHHLSLWGSILVYFGAMLVLNLSSIFGTAGGDYYGSVSRLLRTPSYWVTVLITVISALYFDILMEAVERFRENRAQAARYAHLIKRTHKLRQVSGAGYRNKKISQKSKSNQKNTKTERVEEEKITSTSTNSTAANTRSDIPGVNHNGQHGGGVIDRTVVFRSSASTSSSIDRKKSSSPKMDEIEMTRNPALSVVHEADESNLEMHVIQKETPSADVDAKSNALPVSTATITTATVVNDAPVAETTPAASATTVVSTTSTVAPVVSSDPTTSMKLPYVPPYEVSAVDVSVDLSDDMDSLSQPLPLLPHKSVLPTVSSKPPSSVIPRFQPLSSTSQMASSVSPYMIRTVSTSSSSNPVAVSTAFGPLISPSNSVISSIAARSSHIRSDAASPAAAAAAAAANSFAAAASRMMDTSDTIQPSPRPIVKKWDEPLQPMQSFHSALSNSNATSSSSPSSSTLNTSPSHGTDPSSVSSATLFVRRERGSVSLLSSLQRGPSIQPIQPDQTPPNIPPYPF